MKSQDRSYICKIISYVNTLEEIFEWSICKCLIPCERVKVKCPIIRKDKIVASWIGKAVQKIADNSAGSMGIFGTNAGSMVPARHTLLR